MTGRVPVHVDGRGRLLVVEHQILGYAPSRVFVVTDAPAGVSRGDHVVPCRQTMVLISGGADVTVGESADRPTRHERLGSPGDLVELHPGEFVSYRLDDPSSTVLVLAETAYRGARPEEVAP